MGVTVGEVTAVLKAQDETMDKCVHTINLLIDRINADHPEQRIPHMEEDHARQHK